MNELIALGAFSFVNAFTPGPNNVMLWASGVQFGFRSTIRHITGIVFGVGSMAIALATGLGALVTQVPQIEIVLKVIGSAYLLYLAYQIAGSQAMRRPTAARPLGVWQALAFQYVNPKAWVFILAAVTTFRPEALPIMLGNLVMAGVIMLVVLSSATSWAAGGTLISRFVTSDRATRVLGLALGALLAATVVYIWL